MQQADASRAVSVQLRRVRWALHGYLLESKLHALRRAVEAKFDPNQPRVPVGNPDGGRWTSTDGGGETSLLSNPGRVGVPLAGGFTGEQAGLTVQSFISSYCRASIHRVLPGQFYQMTIAEVMAAARAGDAAARTCLKLLGRDDYRK
jgi:hypothetical protein